MSAPSAGAKPGAGAFCAPRSSPFEAIRARPAPDSTLPRFISAVCGALCIALSIFKSHPIVAPNGARLPRAPSFRPRATKFTGSRAAASQSLMRLCSCFWAVVIADRRCCRAAAAANAVVVQRAELQAGWTLEASECCVRVKRRDRDFCRWLRMVAFGRLFAS